MKKRRRRKRRKTRSNIREESKRNEEKFTKRRIENNLIRIHLFSLSLSLSFFLSFFLSTNNYKASEVTFFLSYTEKIYIEA